MESNLCSGCQEATAQFQFRWKTIRQPYSQKERNTHSNYDSFRDAVSEDCYICCLLWEQLQRDEFLAWIENANSKVSFSTSMRLTGFDGERYQRLECTALAAKPTEDSTMDQQELSCYVDIPLIPTKHNLTRNTGSPWSGSSSEGSRHESPTEAQQSVDEEDAGLRSVIEGGLQRHGRTWISECLRDHSRCNSDRVKSSWYPDRLIEIKGKSAPEAYNLCLIFTNASPPQGPYLTLSHRWPSESFFKSTQPSLQQLREGFSSSVMPQTFQDAVSATYHLGFHYLWIDSICIIQGDLGDWAEQSAQMHYIYSQALCNLSASWAKDCTARMFPDRHDYHRVGNQIDLRTWTKSEPYRMLDKKLWSHNIEASPLQKRGWVFQERILSKRTIHFCQDQLLWECQELEACESWPCGIPSMDAVEVHRETNQMKQLLSQKGSSDLPRASLDWWDIVKAYSQAHLTKETDRLIAISGVAGAFAALHDRDHSYYVAGMWHQSLKEDMFWAAIEPWKELNYSAPTAYTAPSFSWASVGRGIARVPATPTFKILDVYLSHGSQDPLGVLTGGYLILRGGVLNVQWLPLGKYGKGPALLINGHAELSAILYLDHPINLAETRLYALIGSSSPSERDEDAYPSALILLEGVSGCHGAFRRIGLAHDLRQGDRAEDYLIILSRRYKSNPENIPSLKYYVNDDEHLIKII